MGHSVMLSGVATDKHALKLYITLGDCDQSAVTKAIRQPGAVDVLVPEVTKTVDKALFHESGRIFKTSKLK